MSKPLDAKKAIRAINQNGCLLVFPHNNRPEPASVWSALFPRSKMVWEWDQGGDTRVHDLWHLREQLSRSRKVVYSKWYQGRATFFSREAFVNVLSLFRGSNQQFGPESRGLLDVLEMDSPLSTKMVTGQPLRGGQGSFYFHELRLRTAEQGAQSLHWMDPPLSAGGQIAPYETEVFRPSLCSETA